MLTFCSGVKAKAEKQAARIEVVHEGICLGQEVVLYLIHSVAPAETGWPTAPAETGWPTARARCLTL